MSLTGHDGVGGEPLRTVRVVSVNEGRLTTIQSLKFPSRPTASEQSRNVGQHAETGSRSMTAHCNREAMVGANQEGHGNLAGRRIVGGWRRMAQGPQVRLSYFICSRSRPNSAHQFHQKIGQKTSRTYRPNAL